MSHVPPFSRRSSQRGFTLIELLSVIAVILILAAITIPTIAGARNSANRAKTRTQFSQWTTAFENFKQEYGTYPQFANTAAAHLVNPQGTATGLTGTHFFHDVLAGKRRDGQALTGVTTGNPPPALGQNTRRISFVAFTDSDFVLQADVTAGLAPNNQLNYIRDAFYNTNIAVIVDRDLSGTINGNDAGGGFPPVAAPNGGQSIRPSATLLPTANTGGIRAGVIFYCAPPGSTSEADWILSWK